MAAFTIMLSADRKTVTLSAMGHFDLSHGFALWQYCEPDRNRHENYIIDLADVTDMRDSGLNWLIMFYQWARRGDARVCVVHARPAIACQLLAVGIAHNHEPAWLVDPPPAVVDIRDGSFSRASTAGYETSGLIREEMTNEGSDQPATAATMIAVPPRNLMTSLTIDAPEKSNKRI